MLFCPHIDGPLWEAVQNSTGKECLQVCLGCSWLEFCKKEERSIREVTRSSPFFVPRRTSSLSAENAEGRGEPLSLIREVTRVAAKSAMGVSDFLRMAVRPLRLGPTLYSEIVVQTNGNSPRLRTVLALYVYAAPMGLDCGFAEAVPGQACERTRRESELIFYQVPCTVKSSGALHPPGLHVVS